MEHGRYRTRRAAPSGDGTPHAPARTDTLWACSLNSLRLHERWEALPPRLHRTLQALPAAAAITGTHAHTTLTTTPVTRPLARQATFLHSEGSGPSGPRHPRAATFRCTVSLRDTHPVIIRQVRARLAELSTHATSALPLTVKGGTPKPLTVHISVHKCAALPPGLTLPHLDLGLRNRQAQQQHSYLFGGACPRDLATSPHAACGPHQGGMGRPADRERISHGSNNQLPLPQQSNAEREPPLPEAPGIGLPDGTLPPVRIKITPSSVAEQHVLYMRAPTPSGQKSQSPPLHPPTSTAS
ncbi:hypothetical protein [Streptomyces sp. NBC_00649]|uniref:hypothetical protein n=1 Tax=Streptomyces sp. NBC_00649 TaxID=2975798 RepID=UPI00325447EB